MGNPAQLIIAAPWMFVALYGIVVVFVQQQLSIDGFYVGYFKPTTIIEL